MPARSYTRCWLSLCLTVAFAAAVASAETANFEELEEGFFGDTLSSGGITFFEPDAGFGGGDIWAIDDGTDVWALYPDMLDFIDGKLLNINGYSSGPTGYLFVATTSLKMTTGGIRSHAEVSVAYQVAGGGTDWSQNILYLEALLGDNVVATTDPVFTDNVLMDTGRAQYGASRLVLDGVNFDTIRVVTTGPGNGGILLAGLDNVVLTPEPAGLAVFVVGLALVRRWR